MKRMRYLTLAAVACVTIYALFFDDKPQRREPAEEVEAGVVSDTARLSPVDTSIVSCTPAAHVQRLAEKSMLPDAGREWDFGELLFDLHEVYRLAQAYERGDSIDTARVRRLEDRLNYLMTIDTTNQNQ
ncbi:MAG: hypothetical protein K2H70_03830 [Bacteroidales bacterium]|nr:hypothetical protein [Bacteroidales bacterium]